MWRNHNSSIILVEAITMHFWLSLCAPRPFIDHWHSTGNVSFIFKTMTNHILQPDLDVCVRQLNLLEWHALKLSASLTSFTNSLSLSFPIPLCLTLVVHITFHASPRGFVDFYWISTHYHRMLSHAFEMVCVCHLVGMMPIKYILIPFDCRFRSISMGFFY